jgi:hypothetical protein
MPARMFYAIRDTHTFRGSITLCIPLGLLIIAFGLLMRRPLTALMSERARWVSLRAAERFASRPVNWLLAVPAVLVGSWTHILWDAFTHPGTWLVRRIDVLSAPITVFGISSEVSHVLQYASSIIGLAVLVYWYFQVAAEAPPEVADAGNQPTPRWLLLALVMVAAIAVGSLHFVRTVSHSLTFYGTTYLLLTRTLAWFAILYVTVGTLLTLTERVQPQPET